MREIDFDGGKEQVYSTAGRGETFQEILARRLSRRGLMKGGVAASAMVLTAPVLANGVAAQEASPAASPMASPAAGSSLTFQAIAADNGPDLVVAAGYTATPFLAWGEPLTSGAAPFDPATLTAADQATRIGYNHDFVGFLPLPMGSDTSEHGLLVINHEYTNPELMFPGYLQPNPEYVAGSEDIPEFLAAPTQANVDVELEAHGVSVVEIQKGADGQWAVVADSPYNRRITATTPIAIVGPAAGHELLKTTDDATGATVLGTLNNCAGGLTPWGTYVTCEENFHQYFANLGQLPETDPDRVLLSRYGLLEEGSERQWEKFYPRFDIAAEPHEPFRFGWAVEIDPYDAATTPKKRTALGRVKHEAVNVVVAPSGKVVLYSGDDERFDYVYKFVTEGTYNPDDRAANMDLLDAGTLYVAKFNDDGSGEWMPLIAGEGPLTAEAGFPTQAEVAVNTRLAADLLGPTKMDRPEDIEQNPITGKVYMVMTNNTQRGTEGRAPTDNANPRPENAFGHIIEVTEEGGDHAATTFAWDIFILCGDPTDPSTYFADFPKEMVSKIANPDNITFDAAGNLWITTDGQPSSLEVKDGIFAVPTEGAERGYLRQFFSTVPGAEMSGPILTPDNTTLFAAIQHPGEGGTYEEPITSWPGTSGTPRPGLVVIQHESGGRIGS
jgi:secreted PhoX family phosphatase